MDLDRALTAAAAAARVQDQGFAVLTPQALAGVAGHPLAELAALVPFWDDLPPDEYLRDLGRYRSRRHGCGVVDVRGGAAEYTAAPHRPHWQSTDYNALHGGIERWFAAIDPRMAGAAVWRDLIARLGACVATVRPPAGGRWFVEAHPFRIDTSEGIGRPTPEGAHRDGVDFVAVIFVGRRGVHGGETRVFEATGPRGVRFTLEVPWTTLLLDDTRVIHESTPIVPVAAGGRRDTLVLTYRAGGFQAPSDG
ncbi:MAG: 2OG-Fe dioxygenase family protein [Myxococcales bacterium]|nr:2OG-Fe dioxygenase family protein [Myxococcales bacterium]